MHINRPPGNPLQLESYDVEPTKIPSWDLYIGNYYDVNDPELIKELGIKSIINVAGVVPQTISIGVNYCLYPLSQPFGDTKILALQAVESIKQLLKLGPVLVHCWTGKDRAPTVVWRFLSHYMDGNKVEEIIKTLRPISIIHRSWFD